MVVNGAFTTLNEPLKRHWYSSWQKTCYKGVFLKTKSLERLWITWRYWFKAGDSPPIFVLRSIVCWATRRWFETIAVDERHWKWLNVFEASSYRFKLCSWMASLKTKIVCDATLHRDLGNGPICKFDLWFERQGQARVRARGSLDKLVFRNPTYGRYLELNCQGFKLIELGECLAKMKRIRNTLSLKCDRRDSTHKSEDQCTVDSRGYGIERATPVRQLRKPTSQCIQNNSVWTNTWAFYKLRFAGCPHKLENRSMWCVRCYGEKTALKHH